MTIKMPRVARAIIKEELTDSDEVSTVEDDVACEDNPDIKSETLANSEVETDSSRSSSNGDTDDEDNQGNGNESEDNINTGWADSISKILKTNKPKKKKTLVLSKAKKLTDLHREKTKPAEFEVETLDGVVKEEHVAPENVKETEIKEGPTRKKKRDILSIRVKPNILERDRERLLSKIATKGVVQLFNAVKQQQKEIKTKLAQAGPLEIKRDKILKSIGKRSFLDHLMTDKSKSVQFEGQLAKNGVTSAIKDDSTWNVLRDDFMMGASKMKDWDKELENDIDESEEMEIEHELENN